MKKKKNLKSENEKLNQIPEKIPPSGEVLDSSHSERTAVSIPSPDESSIIETISSPEVVDQNGPGTLFDEKTTKILHDRAFELSRSQKETSTKPILELVIFGIGEELYAFRTHPIHEIRLVEDVTPVPCTPNYILGVTNIRGLIYSIVDLGRFLGLESVKLTDQSRLILVGQEGIELGFLVDRVIEKVDVRADQLIRSSAALRGIKDENVEGIITFQNKMVIVLDINHLLKDESIIISEHVS